MEQRQLDDYMSVRLPEPTTVFWKRGRLKTFDSWPMRKASRCNAERMADAGFYVIGNSKEPDLVECFICGKQLDGWEPHDDPWDEHAKHQPDCPFIKMNKRDERDITMGELYELYKDYYLKDHKRRVNEYTAMLRSAVEESKDELLMAHKMRLKSERFKDDC